MQHPRWGEIVGIFSSRALAAGEELLCNYGYNPWQTVAIPEVETVVVRTGFNWGLFARV